MVTQLSRERAKETVEKTVQLAASCKTSSLAHIQDRELLGKAELVMQAFSSFHNELKTTFANEALLKELPEEAVICVRYYFELKAIQEIAVRIQQLYNPELICSLKNYVYSFQKIVSIFEAQRAKKLQKECALLVDELEKSYQRNCQKTKSYQEALWNEALSQPESETTKDSDQRVDCTQQARQMLEKEIASYEKQKNVVSWKQCDYTFLTSKTFAVSKKPRASVGASVKREIIVFDPHNSPHLQTHYTKLLGALTAAHKLEKLTTQRMLRLVCNYVRLKIFPSITDPEVEKRVTELLESYPQKQNESVLDVKGEMRLTVPLDYFVEKGVAVCRHHALVTMYLLDRLSRDKEAPFIPPGRVMQMREEVHATSRHAWAAYIEPARRWHIDTTLNIVAEFTTQEEEEALLQYGYSKKVIASQVKKADLVQARWSTVL